MKSALLVFTLFVFSSTHAASVVDLARVNLELTERAPMEIQTLIRGADPISKSNACDKVKALSLAAATFSNHSDPVTIEALRLDPAQVRLILELVPDLRTILDGYCDPAGNMTQIDAINLADRIASRLASRARP